MNAWARLRRWFGEGVRRQVKAFTAAVRQVLPVRSHPIPTETQNPGADWCGWTWQVSKLLVFTTAEMLESVCGEAVHWYTLHPLTYLQIRRQC